ncbi:MAG: hypothetical protein KIH64_010705 [Mycobacterium sp.]|nr:hypothetical protein [Mycobacterium sp.]
MFETTPPPLGSHSGPDAVDLSELEDPLAAVLAAELSSAFVQLCMCSTEPVVARLAGQEVMLRKAGGIDLSKRVFAQQMYRRIDADVFHLLRSCVPLEHAEFALSRIETLLRDQFADIVETAASYLLSDDRETAIQMATVATTMASREVRSRVVEVIAQTRQFDVD